MEAALRTEMRDKFEQAAIRFREGTLFSSAGMQYLFCLEAKETGSGVTLPCVFIREPEPRKGHAHVRGWSARDGLHGTQVFVC